MTLTGRELMAMKYTAMAREDLDLAEQTERAYARAHSDTDDPIGAYCHELTVSGLRDRAEVFKHAADLLMSEELFTPDDDDDDLF